MNSLLRSDIIQWDVKAWSHALHYWESHVEWNNISNALELGSRQGGLSLWLGLKGISVTCSDVDNTYETARPLHAKYSIERFIEYKIINACEIPYENHFELIVFKSILGGIGYNNNWNAQKLALKQIHKALKPKGYLLFAENLLASRFHRMMRNKFAAWGSQWRYPSLNEMRILLRDFSAFELKTRGVTGTFGRSERQRTILSSVDNTLLNALTPNSWKYIGYGVARK